jgi:UDP-galactopyranose mutase
MYDYLIVGAGLFGAVFAREMAEHGRTCLVMDKREHIGGNCYTEDVDGIQVHRYGAHIFHTNDKRIWDYVQRFAAWIPYRHSVKAWYRGKAYSFPINLRTLEEL